MNSALPPLVCHADWSKWSNKRWLCIADPRSDGYRIGKPEPVGDIRSLAQRLQDRATGAAVLLGIDCPVGIPVAYARAAGIRSFVDWLPILGRDRWREFFHVARHADDISIWRPFYPFNGSEPRSKTELCEALGLDDNDALLRRCERKTSARRSAAESLFWTLGPRQVGKAAITAWRDFLQPALRASPDSTTIWPFHGDLQDLLDCSSLVVAETYPAESGLHIGLPATGKGWSKRTQLDRAARGAEIADWARRRNVAMTDDALVAMHEGFGPAPDGEDPFDSLVGVAGMLEVILGHRPPLPPLADEVRRIEGWIFGQAH